MFKDELYITFCIVLSASSKFKYILKSQNQSKIINKKKKLNNHDKF